MRRNSALACCLIATATLSGCATVYKSFYRETNHKLQPPPVAADEVKVVKSKDDLVSAWTEVGTYKGHAPTLVEAMDAAKSTCGPAGADYFILYTEPYEARGVWKVDGICAARGES